MFKADPSSRPYHPNIIVRSALLQRARNENIPVWIEKLEGNALVLALAQACLDTTGTLFGLSHRSPLNGDPENKQAWLNAMASFADLTGFAVTEAALGPAPKGIFTSFIRELRDVMVNWSDLIELLQSPAYPYADARHLFHEVAGYTTRHIKVEYLETKRLALSEISIAQLEAVKAEGIYVPWKLNSIVLKKDDPLCAYFKPVSQCNPAFFRPKGNPTTIPSAVTLQG